MGAYDELAPYYDRWQDGLRRPRDWADLALALYDEVRGTDGEALRILDFGCGSGSVAVALANRGHFVTGTDLSGGMIEIARARSCEGRKPVFLAGDINVSEPSALAPNRLHQAEIGTDYDLVIAYLETFNHFSDPEDLLRTLQSLAAYLAPHGLLFFDVLRKAYMKDVLPELVFGESLDEAGEVYLIWENETFTSPLRNRAKLNFFRREADGLYRKVEKCVEERYYSASALRACMKSAGLEMIGEVDPLSLIPLEEDGFYSEDRHFYVAGKLLDP